MAGAYSSTTGKKRKRAVNLPKLAEPQMITLTGLPANRTGFRVIRSAHAAEDAATDIPETEEQSMLEINRRQRSAGTTAKKQSKAPVKVSRVDAGLLTLVLPEGATMDDATAIMEQFGLTDDYAIREDEGFISLVRKTEEGEEVAEGTPINLAGGISATVDPSMFPAAIARADSGEGLLVVARMDFDIAHFESLEDVRDYLTKNEIDYIEDGVEQVDGGVIVHRVEADSYNGKGIKIELAPGLIAHVTRGETESIPVAIRRAVTDAAFGSFGMGHLDFSAALVDPEFSSQAGNAIFQLSDVLDNIVFRSGLPLGDRKELIVKATADFAGFMGGLMDAVGDMGFAERTDKGGSDEVKDEGTTTVATPDADAEATARTDEGEGTEAPAKDAETDDGTAAEAAARADTDDDGEAKDTAGEGDESEGDLPIAAVTRKDIEDVVKVALEAAGTTFGEALKGVSESVEKTTKRLDDIAETVTGMGKKVEKIGESTHVARSDEIDDDLLVGDGSNGAKEDVFKGAFGNSFPRSIRRN